MKRILSLVILLFFIVSSNAQNVFQQEVDAIVLRNDTLYNPLKETIIFTGSSSIRYWKDVQKRFPEHQILNAGFGGSQAYDLLYHLENLVLKYQPKKVFIYEGDNDIFSKKKPKEIIVTTKEIIKKIKDKNPDTSIVLISVKPSISRWNLRKKYKKLNREFQEISNTDDKIFYADVWNIMLKRRKVRKDIFIEDGLHMNKIGYELWYEALKKYIN